MVYHIFNQINAALVSIKYFFQKHTHTHTHTKLLNLKIGIYETLDTFTGIVFIYN